MNSVQTVGLCGQEAIYVHQRPFMTSTIFNVKSDRLTSLREFSVVIFVTAIYFLPADGVVTMTTTFLGQGLAGTPGTQGREAV